MVDKTIYTGGVINDKQGDLTASYVTQTGCFPTSVATAFGTWNDSTGVFTAPDITFGAAGQPDGILFKVRVEIFDTLNGQYGTSTIKVIQVSGTGDMTTSESSAVVQNQGTEEEAHANCWAICHNPSAEATFSIQMRFGGIGGHAATDDFLNTALEIIPIYYSSIGMYSSTSTSVYSGTTANQITGWATDLESDTAQIQRNGNGIDLKGDNKRYLVFANSRWDGFTGDHTQRIIKLYADDTPLSMSKICWDNATFADFCGTCLTDIVETVTATVDLDLRMYQGDGTAARQGGAHNTGSAPDSSAVHSLVVLELKDGCEVFRSYDPTGLQEAVGTSGSPLDIDVCDTVDFNDSASWTKSDEHAMNAEVAMDCLSGANIAIPSEGLSGFRWSGEVKLTVNGTEELRSADSDMCIGNLSGNGYFGFVANPLGVITLAQNDDLGVSVEEYAATQGGAGRSMESEDFGSDEGIVFWGINLDTMDDDGAVIPQIMHYRTVQASN
jgi:hypothetical protein